MSAYKILLVDDEAPQRQMLGGFLKKKGYEILEAENGQKALDTVTKESVDIVLSDMRMPEMGGLDLLKAIKELNPVIEIIMMTAYGSVETAVEAMQNGAFTFITKPVDLGQLSLYIERALEHKFLQEENRELRARMGAVNVKDVIAQSDDMREVLGVVARVAPSRASVLILGESGTGKEVIARAIHAGSPRAEKPLVAVNVAAIPESLVESELFGHEKGSFTGANSRHIGKFEKANGGTLFIDEVGDMPMSAQVKLLRVLQEGQIERVGSEDGIKIDVRVVAATHQNLEELIRAGKFREDLFYRLNVVRLNIPPLRNRKTDIPPLVDFFVQKYSEINGIEVEGVNRDALDILMKYNWPGNVRELENAIESALVLCRGNVINQRDLPPNVRGEINLTTSGSFPGDDPSLTLPERLDRFEKNEVLSAIKEAAGNKSEAARKLGMSEKNIRDRLKRWGE